MKCEKVKLAIFAAWLSSKRLQNLFQFRYVLGRNPNSLKFFTLQNLCFYCILLFSQRIHQYFNPRKGLIKLRLNKLG